MLQLIQRGSLNAINVYRVEESGSEFTKAGSDWFLKEEGNQLNHWTEFICMSIDKSYFASLSVIHNLQSHKAAPRPGKAGIRQPAREYSELPGFPLTTPSDLLGLFQISLQGQVLELGLDNLRTAPPPPA